MSSGERLMAVAGFVLIVAALVAGAAGATGAAAALGLVGALLMLYLGWQQTRRA